MGAMMQATRGLLLGIGLIQLVHGSDRSMSCADVRRLYRNTGDPAQPACCGHKNSSFTPANISAAAAVCEPLALEMQLVHGFIFLRQIEDKAVDSQSPATFGKIAPNGLRVSGWSGESSKLLKSIGSGETRMAMHMLVYDSSEHPPLSLFSEFPFGLWPDQMEEFLENRGGTELLNQYLQETLGLDLVAFPAAVMESSSGGWSTKRLDTIEDFSGLKARAINIMAEVLKTANVTTFPLSATKIAPEVAAGNLDFVEFNSPAVDYSFRDCCKFEFEDAFTYYYLNTWSERSNVYYWMISKPFYDSWDSDTQAKFHADRKAGLASNTAWQKQQNAEKFALMAPNVTALQMNSSIIEWFRQKFEESILPDLLADEDFAKIYAVYNETRTAVTTQGYPVAYQQ